MSRKGDSFEKSVSNLVERPQDRFVPRRSVEKLMKNALDNDCRKTVSENAMDLMVECVTEFIGFIAQEGLDRAESDRRRVLNGEDILWALDNLGFDMYNGHMKVLLKRYREKEQEKKTRKRAPRKKKVVKEKEGV